MEDDLNGRRPRWKTTSMEDDHNGKWPQWKTTLREDDLKGRMNASMEEYLKLTSIEALQEADNISLPS